MLKLHAAMVERGIEPPSYNRKPHEARTEAVECEFGGLRFIVAEAVFRPNDVTMPLVDAVIERLAGKERPVVADVGTGCGAAAITIAARLPAARVYALDISEAAVACARTNAERLEIGNVEVLSGSLLEPLADAGIRVDAIITNIPWVAPSIVQVAELHRPGGWRGPIQTVQGEDRDGLGLQRALLAQSAAVLKPGGIIGLDLDNWQIELFAEECAADFEVTIGAARAYLILRSRGDGSTPAP